MMPCNICAPREIARRILAPRPYGPALLARPKLLLAILSNSLGSSQQVSPACNIKKGIYDALFYIARPERLELPTLWFEARYSIQLSYGRIRQYCTCEINF